MADLIKDATQLVKWRDVPALAIRVSIPNVNLLGTKGSILYGTGKPVTSEASIDGETYQYAEVKALNPTSVKSVLFNDGDGNLSWTNVVDNLTTNDDSKVLSAKVGYNIDSKIHISNATGSGITMGAGASTKYNSSIAIGSNAISAMTNSIQLGSGTNETAMSFQVGNHQMLDLSTGKIPLDRINYQVGQKGTTTISLGGTPGTTLKNTVYGINATTPNIATDATAIGYSASASVGCVALGAQAYCNKKAVYGIAIGFKSALGEETEGAYLDSCIAIGNKAKIDNSFYKKDAIQLGTGTNSDGGFQVWRHQLMDSDGIIPLERRPTYRCKLTKQVIAGSGSGALTRTYVFEWYSSSSSKESAIFDNFSVFGYEEKELSGYPTNTYNLYNAILKITKNATIDESVTTIYVDDDTNTTKISGKLSEFTFTAQLI